MIADLFVNSENTIQRLAQRLVSNDMWAVSSTVIALVICLFMSYPNILTLDAQYVQDSNWEAIMQKVDNPLFDLLNQYNPRSAAANMNFRLTVPIIAYPFGIMISPAGMLAIQAGFGVLLLYFVIRTSFRITQDRLTALYMGILVGSIFAGITAFWEVRGRFDGVALCFLLLALTGRNPILILISVFLSGWTDERGLIASSLVFVYYMIEPVLMFDKPEVASVFNRRSLSVVAAWVLYFVFRLIATDVIGLRNNGGGNLGIDYFIDEFNNFPMALWTGLEGGWLLTGLAIILLIKLRRYLSAFLTLGSILVIAVVAQMVVDKTRSMAYLLPVLFIALLILRQDSILSTRRLCLIGALTSLVAVNYYAGGEHTIWWIYPFPLQIVRELMGLSRGIPSTEG